MTQIKKHLLHITMCAMALLWFNAPMNAYAENSLPPVVQAKAHAPLSPVGHGTYRKFGFTIYHATLWAPQGVWDARKPHAIELHYARGLSKDTVADSVVDDIRDQKATDDDTFAKWEAKMRDAIPAVKDGDTMIALAVPGKGAELYFNGTQIADIHDEAFSRAFFNIWLGEDADESLRSKLLGQAE